jgi:hypothetical protein
MAGGSYSWVLDAGGFEITDLEPTAKRVEIAGDRMAIVYADGKQGIVKLVRFKINVPLPISGPDTETALDPIFDQVFIKPETEDLQPIVPE